MQALRPKLWAPLVLVLGGVGAFAASQGAPVEAADHNDPPNRVHSATPTADDRPADIADVFAWTRGSGATQTTVFALSFDGPNAPTVTTMPCDRDVLYQIHITSDAGICPASVVDDASGMTYTCMGATAGTDCGHYTPTGGSLTQCHPAFTDMHTINVRFAQNGMAGCVVEAEFVGNDGATSISSTLGGLTGTNIVSGSTSLYAGLRDDAFFFDLAGFQQTLATGTLSFTGADFFGGKNTPVIVLEFPTSAISLSTHALPATGSVIRVWGSTARFHEHT